jgi:cytochrome c peroxidase
MSCTTCHQPGLYGTDGLATSIGVQQRPHPRNAPTILNSALSITHWRGDRESVEDQVIKAMTSPITFGQPNEKAVLDRVARIPGFAPLFKAAFPDDATTMSAQNIATAIGAYERTLVTPSPFDGYLAGNINALSPTARAGLEKFISTGCIADHEGVGVGGTMYRKFGVTEDYWKATGSQVIDKGRVDVTKALMIFTSSAFQACALTRDHGSGVVKIPGAARRPRHPERSVIMVSENRPAQQHEKFGETFGTRLSD